MKLGIFSDTHMMHRYWYNTFITDDVKHEFNDADILLFTGDCSGHGLDYEVDDFLKWFDSSPRCTS